LAIVPLLSCLLREEYMPDFQNSTMPGTSRVPAMPCWFSTGKVV